MPATLPWCQLTDLWDGPLLKEYSCSSFVGALVLRTSVAVSPELAEEPSTAISAEKSAAEKPQGGAL